jgi:hypothetical protein
MIPAARQNVMLNTSLADPRRRTVASTLDQIHGARVNGPGLKTTIEQRIGEPLPQLRGDLRVFTTIGNEKLHRSLARRILRNLIGDPSGK